MRTGIMRAFEGFHCELTLAALATIAQIVASFSRGAARERYVIIKGARFFRSRCWLLRMGRSFRTGIRVFDVAVFLLGPRCQGRFRPIIQKGVRRLKFVWNMTLGGQRRGSFWALAWASSSGRCKTLPNFTELSECRLGRRGPLQSVPHQPLPPGHTIVSRGVWKVAEKNARSPCWASKPVYALRAREPAEFRFGHFRNHYLLGRRSDSGGREENAPGWADRSASNINRIIQRHMSKIQWGRPGTSRYDETPSSLGTSF